MITRVEEDEIEGINVYSEGYNPSQKQFDEYLAREVVLCKSNIARSSRDSDQCGTKSGDTGIVLLHSWATCLEAVTGIKVERKPC